MFLRPLRAPGSISPFLARIGSSWFPACSAILYVIAPLSLALLTIRELLFLWLHAPVVLARQVALESVPSSLLVQVIRSLLLPVGTAYQRGPVLLLYSTRNKPETAINGYSVFNTLSDKALSSAFKSVRDGVFDILAAEGRPELAVPGRPLLLLLAPWVDLSVDVDLPALVLVVEATDDATEGRLVAVAGAGLVVDVAVLDVAVAANGRAEDLTAAVAVTAVARVALTVVFFVAVAVPDLAVFAAETPDDATEDALLGFVASVIILCSKE